MEELQGAGISAAAVYSVANLVTSRHLRERGFVSKVSDSGQGDPLVFLNPWLVDGQRNGTYNRSPTLGEHNEYVFGELLGLSRYEIARLVEEQVIY
jgi:crotonobetainyl-CoA:carnitine CoA-transferase CaiB-like acyl-CoA transferase